MDDEEQDEQDEQDEGMESPKEVRFPPMTDDTHDWGAWTGWRCSPEPHTRSHGVERRRRLCRMCGRTTWSSCSRRAGRTRSPRPQLCGELAAHHS